MTAVRAWSVAAASVLLCSCAAQPSHGMSSVLLLVLAHCWLSMVAFAMPARWTGLERMFGALLALGLMAFAAFWCYFAAPGLGHAAAVVMLLSPPAAAAALWRGRELPGRDLLRLQVLALPSLALAALVLWIGLYPFAWEGNDWTVPAHRWRDMPVDNWLSFQFAQMLADGKIIIPMLEQWLTSDRPPLQVGLSLVFRDIIQDHAGLSYQVISSWAQALVLIPLIALLDGVRSRFGRAACLCVVGLSALVVLNTLFVWPKLLAATYCAIYHLLLFRGGRVPRRRVLFDVAIGVSAALALLSHGGAAFALIGSTVAWLAARRPAAIPRLLTIALSSIALYLPWVLYQRLVDPPGDRLLKWHFAGQIDVTDKSLGRVMLDAYASQPLQSWIDAKQANVATIFSGTVQFFRDAWQLLAGGADGAHVALSEPMLQASFFSTAYGMWLFSPLLVLPLFAWGVARSSLKRATFPAGLAAASLVSMLAWIVLMYMPGSTIVHAGSYFTTIAVQLLVMLLALQVAPFLFHVLAFGNIGLFFMIYVLDRPATAVPGYDTYLLVGIALMAAFLAACLRATATPALPQSNPGHQP